jgi:hypothetical protein
MKEKESAVTEQWHYGKITSGQEMTSRTKVAMDGWPITAPISLHVKLVLEVRLEMDLGLKAIL